MKLIDTLKRHAVLLICILTHGYTIQSYATEELEVGIGLGYAHIPDYIGSDEADDYVVPFPYIRYRSEKLNVDRNAIQSNLWRSGNWSLELSFSGAVRVESDENQAREGMEDIDFIGEAGPALHYYFQGDRTSDNAFFLILPLRPVISTDFTSLSYRGVSFNPRLRWHKSYFYNGLEVRPQLSAELRSATAGYHDYLYGVDPTFATAERQPYSASKGYGGYTLNYSTELVLDHYLLAGFIHYVNINGATFADSPLVRQNSNVFFGVAAAYLF